MNTAGFVKYAGALVAIAISSACGALRQAQGDMAVAPSAATLNATYVGRTLFVNGRPVTAARLSPLPTYATIVPDRHASRRPLSTSSTTTIPTPAFSTIRRASGDRYDRWRRWPRVHERPLRLREEDLLERRGPMTRSRSTRSLRR